VGVKKPKWTNSKKYGAKVKLYHGENKEITFYVSYKVAGKKFLKPIGKKSNGWTEKRAFEQRAKLIDKAKYGTGVHSDMVQVGELAAEYFDWAELHNRSWKKTEQKYNKHLSYLDKRIVMSLKDIDVTKLQKKLKDKKLSDAYNNDIVGILTAIVNFGVKKGIIEYSPFKDLKKLKVDNTRTRFLSMEEIALLEKTVKDNKYFYNFVILALGVGARASSILRIQKRDIDFKNMNINIEDIKRGSFYTNPINKKIYDAFIDFDEDILCGGTSYHTFYNAFKKVLDRLFNKGLSPKDKRRVRMHTLRHTYASHLALNNTPLDKMQKLMNHADIKMTLRYAHLMPDAGEEFVKKLYKESK
jgi:integrase